MGTKFLIADKTLSEYMAGKLSTAGISIETLQKVVVDKGVDGLDELLRTFTKEKIAVAIYSKLCSK